MTEIIGGDIFGDIRPVEGFYPIEWDNFGEFVWSKKSFSIRRPRGLRYWSTEMCFNGHDAALTYGDEGGAKSCITVCRGWNTYPLDFSHCNDEVIRLDLSRVIAVRGDFRELGLMFRRFRPVKSGATLEVISKALDNTRLNREEFLLGETILESGPQSLRISIETRCNMKPHCVYCDWERTKRQEKNSGFTHNFGSLSNMGLFYYNASRVIEASIGEPLLSADLGDIVASLDESGKMFEMTTNGILLDEANRRKFLGRNVLLSVSIDAGSAQGYAKYRNDRFETVIDNLRELCRSKRHFRNLPWVVVVFIAMPSNLGEIERFLDLMKDVGVDLIKVKSLYPYSNLRDRVVRRAGGVFRYGDEVLGLEQLKEVYHRSAEAAKERGLVLVTDINVVQENASDRDPLCRLPWETMYATTNGPNICQYMRYRPLADWRAVKGHSVENFLESIWNGEEYRQIRSALAQYRLPERCREASACPVTQRILGDV